MEKNIIIGTIAVASAVLIGGAIYQASNSREIELKSGEGATQEQKEALFREELKDTSKYSFCLGQAKIQTAYTDPVLNSNGQIDYQSKELLVLDKQRNRFLVLGIEAKYTNKGTVAMPMGDLTTNVPIDERGTISEYYSKNEAPIRIDYGSNSIFTVIDTREKNWVISNLDESQKVSPAIGCPGVFALDNAPGKDLLAGSDNILIDRECEMSDISGKYSGEFSYRCTAVDYRQAESLMDEFKTKDELYKTKDLTPFDSSQEKPEINDASAGGQTPEPEKSQANPENVQDLLQQIKDDMKADQTSN